MYTDFYGFSEEPFNITPDPKFIYWSPTHKEALASLAYGLKDRRGFICLVAEVGLGKTTLINVLLNKLGEDTITSVVNTPKAGFMEILKLMLTDFGLPVEGLGRFELLETLKSFIARQSERHKNVVLIIDESHCLEDSVFEDLRLLSNFETARHKLLQILLVGQPELIDKLKQPHLRQLKQRLSVNCYINPLTISEIEEYIYHRLGKVNHKHREIFSRSALKMIENYSNGIPRVINIVCHNALLIGYGLGKKQIAQKIIEEVIHDLEFVDIQTEKTAEQERGTKHSSSVHIIATVVVVGLIVMLLIVMVS